MPAIIVVGTQWGDEGKGKIIDIISGRGIPVKEEPISAAEIGSFDAAFISGTSPKVLPIASIGEEDYDVNDPLLRDIMKWYDEAFSAGQSPSI